MFATLIRPIRSLYSRSCMWFIARRIVRTATANAEVTPVSFQHVDADRQRDFGDVDRTPCHCPQCRHARRQEHMRDAA